MLKRARLSEKPAAIAGVQAIQKFLDVLHERDGVRAFVGGGFPRDLHEGQQPKDIDLYVSRSQYWEAWKVLFPKQKIDWDKVSEDVDSPAYQHQMVAAQHERVMSAKNYPLQFKLPINLIGIHSHEWRPMERIDKLAEKIIGAYDFGMCMAAITPTGLWVDDRFIKDVTQKTCTLYREFSREHAVKHYNRFKHKYPWPMVELNPPKKTKTKASTQARFKRDLDDEIPF